MYKRILVHVDNSEASPGRVRSAVALAQRFDAKLHGCCVVPELSLAAFGGAPVPPDIINEQATMLENDLASAQELYHKGVANAAIASQCTAQQGPVAQLVATSGRYTDLVVVGKHAVDDYRCHSAGLGVSVAFASAVPVVVVPPAPGSETMGSRIAIGWNATREAQAAVRNALPLLTASQHVDVLCVVDGHGRVGGQDDAAQQLCRYLKEHGVTSDPHYIAADVVDEGDTLLARCTDLGTDLLILGAYGHSRMREFFLGGVTRSVLEDHTIPLLLSH